MFRLYLFYPRHTCTVFLILCEGPGYSGEYNSVKNNELINVDFPSPDSPRRKQNSFSKTRKYHAVIEQEQNISCARQYFLETTGWNCKGIEALWIVSLRYWHNQGTNIPWNYVKCRQIPVKWQREDHVIHRSEILENVCLGKSLLHAQRVGRKGVCRLESEYFYNCSFFHSLITIPLQRKVEEKFEW